MSSISAGTTSGTALVSTGDTTGTLDLKTGASATTALSIDASQNITFTNQPTYTGGTANGVLYLNGSKVATSGTALVFDGTNLGIGTSSPNVNLDVRGATGNGIRWLETSSGNTTRIQLGTAAGFGYIDADAGAGSVALGFRVGGANLMTLDASGNLGIGTTSPTTGRRLHIVNTSSYSICALLESQSTSGATISFKDANSTGNNNVRVGSAADDLVAYAGNAERARIDSSGNFLVGTTTAKSTLTVQGQGAFGSTGAGGNGIYLYINNALSDNSYLSRGSAGTGTTTWYIGNQTITTSSDVRLKENIKPTERNALELLNQWEIIDHTWNDPSDQCENNRNSRGVWTGVKAQQVQPITPWLVNKPLQDTNEDGSINPWVMDFGYSVPLLVKAIQELKAELDTAKARIAALESK